MKKKNTGTQTEKWTVETSAELLKFLIDKMPTQSRKSIKSILGRGQVYINGTGTTQFNDVLQPGDIVEIRQERSNIKIKGMKIFYEDSDIIVIDKDAGLLSIASDKENQMTAYRLLSDYVQSAHPKNRIFIVHRLDRDTSGVMIFAKSKAVQQKLQNAWKSSVSERTYIAVVEGSVDKDGTVKSYLTENKAFIVRSSRHENKGKKAVTHYKILKKKQSMSLLQINLDTGRKNQIRVHMQDIGHPIVGDKKYGSSINPLRRLGLHAQVIAFQHPATGEHLRFESKVPEAFTKQFK